MDEGVGLAIFILILGVFFGFVLAIVYHDTYKEVRYVIISHDQIVNNSKGE